MSSTSNTPKPKLACEIAADRVLAGRYSDNGGTLEASAARELAPGSVLPDLVENNLRQRDAVRAGIAEALGSVAGRSKDVIAIVPDAAVRVMLVEFDTLPTDYDEALGVVRFRLKKSLPLLQIEAVAHDQLLCPCHRRFLHAYRDLEHLVLWMIAMLPALLPPV